MRKDYYEDINNIPKLDLYTKILGTLYLFLGINCFLTYYFIDDIALKEDGGVALLVLGITMLLFIYPVTTDERRSERNLGAVVGHCFVHGIGTILLAASIMSWRIIVAYIVEVLIIIYQVWSYNKRHT